MDISQLDETARQFIEALYSRTDGSGKTQASMYEVGAAVGLDRDGSAFVAQELMGMGLVEIRTLSGGIGISAEAASLLGSDQGAAAEAPLTLGADPYLDAARIAAVEGVMTEIKTAIGEIGISYEKLSDLIADIRTVEAQLTSSRPKTGVVKDCLAAMAGTGAPLPAGRWKQAIAELVGD